jgi:hypothetical protein
VGAPPNRRWRWLEQPSWLGGLKAAGAPAPAARLRGLRAVPAGGWSAGRKSAPAQLVGGACRRLERRLQVRAYAALGRRLHAAGAAAAVAPLRSSRVAVAGPQRQRRAAHLRRCGGIQKNTRIHRCWRQNCSNEGYFGLSKQH